MRMFVSAQHHHQLMDVLHVKIVMRCMQVLVDAKRFTEAITDFNDALAALEQAQASSTDSDLLTARARMLSGRALAYEGLAEWRKALSDYDEAMVLAAAGGESPGELVCWHCM